MPLEIRPSQALRLWRQVHLDLVRDGESDLSARQTAILLTIYLELPPHTVRGLAAQLGVTKPVITRALDTMGKLGLVTRRRDETDRRNVVIQRTVAGALAVERLADRVVERAREIGAG
ncbi:MAG: MarR family winged helix-turn-helix transcriptional regulator [Bosea sp. (in: a-proteobacteria)]|jgi:DNA-binding MarR family transcriptional regulator|uniref:MarR family winged helix-turn-helix transcriptional regulator n=1 Tax=unclassified Bosea (in: a-proteobacteria) TaxID=2653178 RepID=UPI00083D183E|nr:MULTISPECIES: MarR family winged helix-turn-helix transcriptional regulator [unclassified Bosea (in: a-proteobacteria)]MBA4336127.1 MarR family transcriptional regulator [Methylobacterium sp.]MBX9874952.1 MarR family winged helix-turn-helix transcriptional regulator [Beijerinckiaceae bacterium]AOG06268.1 winged helix DNA-binding domain protein [Bosea sp. RAC05]MCZ8041878.1 MarR family winged helix-turn-helix transcriptional regulator [Beijerinckiaceae bacterium]MDP3601844.1 MarR family wing